MRNEVSTMEFNNDKSLKLEQVIKIYQLFAAQVIFIIFS
jgi:hypothetical protein